MDNAEFTADMPHPDDASPEKSTVELIWEAAQTGDYVFHRKELKDVLFDLDEPLWQCARKKHDWRNYVGDILKRCWEHFSPETRLAIYIVTTQTAEREELN